MDVLVHLLALEQLADITTVDIDLTKSTDPTNGYVRLGGLPRSASASDFFEKAHKVDWVAHSDSFAAADREHTLSAHLRDQRGESELAVCYASGGQLVGGALDAALSLYFGLPVRRELVTDKPVDRSVNALRAAGWSHGDLRALLHKWAVLDPVSAVVLLDVDHGGFPSALHEMTCRYDTVHTEYDYISDVDQAELQTAGVGSIQTMLLRADPTSFAAVTSRHREVLLGSYSQDFSVLPISVLWSPVRQSTMSSRHQQRLRKLRRKERTVQLLEKARNR